MTTHRQINLVWRHTDRLTQCDRQTDKKCDRLTDSLTHWHSALHIHMLACMCKYATHSCVLASYWLGSFKKYYSSQAKNPSDNWWYHSITTTPILLVILHTFCCNINSTVSWAVATIVRGFLSGQQLSRAQFVMDLLLFVQYEVESHMLTKFYKSGILKYTATTCLPYYHPNITQVPHISG